MSTSHLTEGQRALIESALVLRQHGLDRQLAAHHEGLSRSEHARIVRQDEGHDAAQLEGAREIDLALSDLELRELGEVSDALRRLRSGRFGRCTDCEAEIPFDRLKAEPWAQRCVACASRREQGTRRAG
jgi:DnaK suppressor protein